MPIALRPDFDAAMVRAAARRSKDGPQARRLLALAAIYEGATRTEASKIGGVTLQIIRDWVLKFNAHGPEGLIDRKAPGPTPRLNDEQRAALTAIVESGPIPAAHGVVRWRIVDFKKVSPRAWRRSGAKPASAPIASRSGSPTRPASARRTRSPGDGPNGARGRAPRKTSEPPQPTSSGRTARARRSSCPAATPRR